MLFENTKQHLSSYHGYPSGTENILVFDRYDDISAKGHERTRCAREGYTDHDLTINSPLANQDAILKNKQNKLILSRIPTIGATCVEYKATFSRPCFSNSDDVELYILAISSSNSITVFSKESDLALYVQSSVSSGNLF